MVNIIQALEIEQIEKLTSGKSIPAFNPGDTVKISVKVVEGSREAKLEAYRAVRDKLGDRIMQRLGQ